MVLSKLTCDPTQVAYIDTMTVKHTFQLSATKRNLFQILKEANDSSYSIVLELLTHII